MRKVLIYSAVLIGAYLVLTNAKGFKTDVGSAGQGSVNLVKAFQGR